MLQGTFDGLFDRASLKHNPDFVSFVTETYLTLQKEDLMAKNRYSCVVVV